MESLDLLVNYRDIGSGYYLRNDERAVALLEKGSLGFLDVEQLSRNVFCSDLVVFNSFALRRLDDSIGYVFDSNERFNSLFDYAKFYAVGDEFSDKLKISSLDVLSQVVAEDVYKKEKGVDFSEESIMERLSIFSDVPCFNYSYSFFDCVKSFFGTINLRYNPFFSERVKVKEKEILDDIERDSFGRVVFGEKVPFNLREYFSEAGADNMSEEWLKIFMNSWFYLKRPSLKIENVGFMNHINCVNLGGSCDGRSVTRYKSSVIRRGRKVLNEIEFV